MRRDVVLGCSVRNIYSVINGIDVLHEVLREVRGDDEDDDDDDAARDARREGARQTRPCPPFAQHATS